MLLRNPLWDQLEFLISLWPWLFTCYIAMWEKTEMRVGGRGTEDRERETVVI